MFSDFSRRFQVMAVGAVSAASMVWGGYTLWGRAAAADDAALLPVSLASVTQKQPLSVAVFKSHVERYSKDNLMVVLLRRQACAICPGVRAGLEEARAQMQKKYGRGFAVYELDAEQNPEVAALLRQRDPAAAARLHVFYNGEKIYESVGVSEEARHIVAALEMVQALADGEVSAYDKYAPADIFAAPLAVPLAAPAPAAPEAPIAPSTTASATVSATFSATLPAKPAVNVP